MGHTEPVAGAVGVVQAVRTLGDWATAGLMHLRTVNPMVGSLLEAHTEGGKAHPFLPRGDGVGQLAQAGSQDGQQALLGVSAFAFQGTNAHALVVRDDSGSAEGVARVAPQPLWRRQRYWFAAAPHMLLGGVLRSGGGAAEWEAEISSSPAAAYLWDHRVGGRALFPGAAMFETAMGACSLTLQHQPGNPVQSAVPALVSVGIPAPLVLSQPQACMAVKLSIRLHTTSGQVILGSMVPGKKELAVHLKAAVVRVALPAQSSRLGGSASSSGPLNWKLVREVLPSELPCTQPAYPAATCSLEQCPVYQWGTHHLHPAVIDNATQLGGAFTPGEGSSVVTRVPAGVEACLLLHSMHSSSTSRWSAGASITGGGSDGSVACSFRLMGAEQLNCSMLLRGMQFKPIGSRASHTSGPAAKGLEPSDPTQAQQQLYVLEWQSNSPPHMSQIDQPPLNGSIIWQLGLSGRQLVVKRSSTTADLNAVQAGLSLLQMAVGSTARPAVMLQTPLVIPGIPDTSAAYAASAGLLKVAAQVGI